LYYLNPVIGGFSEVLKSLLEAKVYGEEALFKTVVVSNYVP
jgi:hypothetical protein